MNVQHVKLDGEKGYYTPLKAAGIISSLSSYIPGKFSCKSFEIFMRLLQYSSGLLC
ncbi:hypothetical protein Gohar_020249 [Gossypium harknessii]|uniref:Uncharacterized protein n=1 Tax=Gossypium harknessii TaxID=34285 RepID=A0A7J9HX33_9ROSI|nr:hypothetical protein [Gossypium harknessii]